MKDEIFVLVVAFLVMMAVLLSLPVVENFASSEKFEDDELWDEFYADVYDQLFMVPEKVKFEVGVVERDALSKYPASKISILDIGCGTGEYANYLKHPYTGIDISPDMIKHARDKNPEAKFVVGDITNAQHYAPNNFSHILCMTFTIYQFENAQRVLHNCYNWLKPGGFLVLHLVDPDEFDPVLEAASPFPAFSLQKYAKDRVTESEVDFDNFRYRAKFIKKPHSDDAVFEEYFTFKDKKVRQHRHNLKMPSKEKMLDKAKSVGFILEELVDMTPAQYEYQYLAILKK
jgi:SAM-dependent methyltransferase